MAANSRPSVERAGDRDKALETALVQIERQFGKGSVMRLGQEAYVPVETIPTGSISLDVALGIGGLPRGRIVEIYGPESSGKTTVALHAVANAQKAGGIAAFIDAEHALDPEYAKKLGVDTDALLVSQPDTGEQALEIMDMLIRSGAIDIGVEQGFVRKSGAWYTYDGDQLGQGKENARTFLMENDEVGNEIEKKIKEKLGIGAKLDAPADGVAPDPDAPIDLTADVGPTPVDF